MGERPNILWIMTDEQRCDSLGCYGSPWARTPVLDRMAAEGLLFEAAVTPSPMCVPARTSILTGLYPCATGVWQNDSNPRRTASPPVLLAAFEEAGYLTASFGKQHYLLDGRAFGHEEDVTTSSLVDCTRYREPYDPRDYGAIQYPGPTPWILGGRFPGSQEQTSEAEVLRRALGWLDGRDSSRPFLLRLSFNGPHTPVVPPSPYDGLVAEGSIRLPPEADAAGSGEPRWLRALKERYASSLPLSRPQILAMRRFYYGYAAFLDSVCGRLFAELERRSVLDGTIVVYTSDHGTHLGDHEMVQKQTFYDAVVNVPLIVRCPSLLRGARRVRTPVELLRLLPLLGGLAGAVEPREERDAALLGALRGGVEPPDAPLYSEMTLNPEVLRTHERLVMVREGRWKLSVNADDPTEDGALHDLVADPCELENLVDDPDAAAVAGRLRRLILGHLCPGSVP